MKKDSTVLYLLVRNGTAPKIHQAQSLVAELISFKHRTIQHILTDLNINKAAGADGIPPMVPTRCASEFTPVLSKPFALSYGTGATSEI